MTGKKILLFAGGFLAAGVTLFLLYPGMRSTEEKCQLCSEVIHNGMRYTVVLSQGDEFNACCPACGMHLQVHDPARVTSAYATDFATGKRIEAAAACYVEGSDMQHCDPQRMMRNDTGDIYAMKWHRCNPSLVAFAARDAAVAFQAQHGGRLMSFDQAQAAVHTH